MCDGACDGEGLIDFKLFVVFDDRWTNEWTLVVLELLSQLKNVGLL